MLQVFLHMAVVRLKGQVMGYLTPDIGIIEVRTHFFVNVRGKLIPGLGLINTKYLEPYLAFVHSDCRTGSVNFHM
jgi:hypothetical protein